MAKNSKQNQTPHINNRRAWHDYNILEKLEVGIALRGSEVKSIRSAQVSLAEGFARVDPKRMELFLYNVDIPQYAHSSGTNAHEPLRARKLLAHKRQIAKLVGATSAKGTTLVPLAMYFVRGMVKLELGVATGKKHYDKRQKVKSRDADRDIRRGMTRKVI